MPKYIVVGDIHVTPRTLPVFEQLLEELSQYQYPIICLGDFFHSKSSITPTFLLSLRYVLRKYSNLKWYIIEGNHDKITQDLSLLSLIEGWGDIEIITKPTYKNIASKQLLFYPYEEPEKFNQREVLNPASFAFTHLDIDIDGVLPNAAPTIDINKLSKVNYIFNGHIHNVGNKDNICNIGSIYPTSKAEINDNKRYIILDVDNPVNLEEKYIEFIKMIQTNKYIPEYNTPQYIIYFTGNPSEAIKYTEVHKVMYKPSQSETNEYAVLEGEIDIHEEIKNNLISYVKAQGIENTDKIPHLLPQELTYKLFGTKSEEIDKKHIAHIKEFKKELEEGVYNG